MTGSFETIDYRLRPAKHAERQMLVELVSRLRFDHFDQYSYIGMGSIGFIDHRMFHRGLGICDMVSIEATEDETAQERFRQNSPLACITMKFGYTWDIIPQLSYERRSICWLDYDDRLSANMAADMTSLGARLKSGSFLCVSFACGIPLDKVGSDKEINRLREEFPDFVGEDAMPEDFSGKKYSDLGREALGSALERALHDSDATKPYEEQRICSQVCYFRYRDGAAMATVGWVIYKRNEQEAFDSCRLDQLIYYRDANDAFVIKIPKLTPFEVSKLERLMPSDGVPEIEWLKEREREQFKDIYRYLPNFGIFEPV